MYFINDYCFDATRLLFYKPTISESVMDAIRRDIDAKSAAETHHNLVMLEDGSEKVFQRLAVNSMGLCLTYNCNLRCTYCGYSSTDKDKNHLSIDDIKLFVNDIIRKCAIKKLITKRDEPLIVILTGGGEPTFDWRLFEDSVNYIQEQCGLNSIPVKLSLTTNGVLTDEQIRFIAKNFSRVMISYDGLPEIQNSNRRGPKIHDTNPILEHTIRELSSLNVPIEIRTTIWQADYGRMKEMYHHIFSIAQADSNVTWSVYPALAEGRATRKIKKQKDTSYSKFISSYFDLLDYINTEGEIKGDVFCPMFADNVISYFCGSLLGDEPFLQPDGSIVLCNESKDYYVEIGKAKSGAVDYFEDYDNTFLKISQKKINECAGCIAYQFCKGGCPIWHLRGREDSAEPQECQATKEYWTHIIKSAIEGKSYNGWQIKKLEHPGVNDEVYKLVKGENMNET